MTYSYCTLGNPFMRFAYERAKTLYNIKKWNLKTTPIAVIVDMSGNIVTYAACANGQHAIHGHCDRLKTRGSEYSACVYCSELEHAERLALKSVYDINVTGCTLYLYGHYRLCNSCIKALENRGIYQCFFLENADVLFDRHNPHTVLGTEQQFL